ncbi:hypothetical protein [Kitasatospora sp. NPDC088346]|uniref:hypothetical protein n=1 Tax=Kitasatospora sp. NPDC088346 TaxID=3364073 RepID=UPI0037FA2A5A
MIDGQAGAGRHGSYVAQGDTDGTHPEDPEVAIPDTGWGRGMTPQPPKVTPPDTGWGVAATGTRAVSRTV